MLTLELDSDFSIEKKIYNLCNNSQSRALRAVENRAFLTVPFSASTLGVRIGSLAFNLAEAFAALVSKTPLPSVEFTSALLSDDSQAAVAESGVKVYQKLPFYVNKNENLNVNLDEFCPGSSDVTIADPRDDPIRVESANDDDKNLEGWAIGLLVGLGVIASATMAALFHLVKQEKDGKPVFVPPEEPKQDMD